jgi:hypothetical protein
VTKLTQFVEKGSQGALWDVSKCKNWVRNSHDILIEVTVEKKLAHRNEKGKMYISIYSSEL